MWIGGNMAKTAIVTGANRGIGLEIVQQLLGQGLNVIATARNPENADQLLSLAKDYKELLTVSPLDVSKPESVKAFGASLGDTPIDFLFNNAGILVNHSDVPPSIDIDAIQESFNINTLGPIRVYQACRDNLLNAESPKHILTTSKMGSLSDNTSGRAYAYRMSKAAVNMFIRSLSKDDDKVVSVAMHPGWVQTDMGGPNALITTAKSASGMIDFAMKAKSSDSGQFFSYDAQSIPW